MALSEELSRLSELHQRGTLTDEEFSRAKARLLSGGHAGAGTAPPLLAAAVNSYRRSSSDRWLGGVCGGLAQISGLAAWIWRLLFTLLAVCGGTGLVIYLLLWIFVPLEVTRLPEQPGSYRAG